MSILIEKVLSDEDVRERLLDQSVLNDFYFEEKLRERRQQVIQEQMRSNALNKGHRRRGGDEVIDCNLGNEVLDSLQHLPEVIRPEHIKVNISGSVADRGQIINPREKDNLYHRAIVKSKSVSFLIKYRGDISELECEQAQDVAVLKPPDNKLHTALHDRLVQGRQSSGSRSTDLFNHCKPAKGVCVYCDFEQRPVRHNCELQQVDFLHQVDQRALQRDSNDD